MARPIEIAVVLHHPAETPDRFAAALQARGARLRFWEMFTAPVPPHAHGYDGFLLMGGPQSANDEGFIALERRWLAEEVLAAGKPVFGVCLGAQLLAKAAGGEVVPASTPELGFFSVRATEEGLRDPVFAALQEEAEVFQWHGQTWTLPASAVRMAEGFPVREQAFRLGRAQYGIQFHPEVELATIRRWIALGKRERARLGEEGIARLVARAEQGLDAMHALAERMITAWLAEIEAIEGGR